MEIIKIHENLPIYQVKKFSKPLFNKKNIIDDVFHNKKFKSPNPRCINFPLLESKTNFFDNLYLKFFNLCKKKFNFTTKENNSKICWSYLSDKNDYAPIWHNHLKSSTINGVYYLNIPKNDDTSIDFKQNDIFYTHKINEYDLLIFPNYLMHRPNRCYNDGYRISINMEILCNELSDNLFNKYEMTYGRTNDTTRH